MTRADGQAVELDPGLTALLVIDVQNDFCHGDGYFAQFGFDVTPCADVVPASPRSSVLRAVAASRSCGR